LDRFCTECRLFQVCGVSGIGYRMVETVRDASSDGARLKGELRVVFARESERGHGDRRESIVEPFLATRARVTKGIRESTRVAAARRHLDLVAGERGEHRLGEPFVEKCASAYSFDSPRQCLVTVTTPRPLGFVLDASSRAEHDEATHAGRVPQCDVQGYSSAVGVAAQGHGFIGERRRQKICGLL